MKTFFSDIFPKLQRFSQKLDNLTLLTNQHWVSIDNIIANKTVYIFRSNNELLVSTNGKVEKAKWEYLGNKSLLIDKAEESYLFKHGFFDENILALKVDSSEEYAVFVNENNYGGDLNSIQKVFDFLKEKYLEPSLKSHVETATGQRFENTYSPKKSKFVQHQTDKGIVEIEPCINMKGQKAFMNGQPAPDGRYKFGFLWYVEIRNGVVIKSSV
ncbi:MAG: hypothetical protein GC171_13145 [Terrimonas sp.]|nr:hypothetical protein [Terrimonas sp.]